MLKDKEIDPKIISELLDFSESEGLLFWNFRAEKWFVSHRGYKSWNGKWSGNEAFTSTAANGYKQGRIFQRQYTAHRVLWCLKYGEWPDGQVDHINGIRTDNRIVNLRLSDNQRNQMNRTSVIGSSSEFLGVSFYKSRGNWEANIKFGDHKGRIGYFASEIDAAKAYDREARRLFGEYANPNFNEDGTRRDRAVTA